MDKVKGLGTEHTIVSKVRIFTGGEKITRAEDRWNDKSPDGAFKNVSVLSLRSWVYHGLSWGDIEGGVFVWRRRGGGYAR